MRDCMHKYGILGLVMAALLLCQGCTMPQVKAWERGNLARTEMSLVADPMEAKVQSHIYHSKEASSVVTAGSGGGCGCN